VLRRRGTTALATLHTRKGVSTSFRDLMSGSHQYNALSRSSLLLAVHPQDEDRRIVVAGKQNYTRAAMTESFELVEHRFDLNDHRFSVSLAQDFRPEPEITIDSLLASPRAEARDDLSDQLRDVLTTMPQKLSDLARAVNHDPADGTVRRALEALEGAGHAERPDAGCGRAGSRRRRGTARRPGSSRAAGRWRDDEPPAPAPALRDRPLSQGRRLLQGVVSQSREGSAGDPPPAGPCRGPVVRVRVPAVQLLALDQPAAAEGRLMSGLPPEAHAALEDAFLRILRARTGRPVHPLRDDPHPAGERPAPTINLDPNERGTQNVA